MRELRLGALPILRGVGLGAKYRARQSLVERNGGRLGQTVCLGFIAVTVAGVVAFTPYQYLPLVAVGLAGGLISLVLTLRLPWFPVIAYWVLYSFFSGIRSAPIRLQFQGIPITIPDLVVGLIAIGLLAHAWSPQGRAGNSRFVTFGVLALLFDGAASIVLGRAHGYPTYSMLIDVRIIGYLAIGYFAAGLLRIGNGRLLTTVFWLALAGVAFEQVAASLGALRRLQLEGGQLQNYRDISVSFFTGKYGVLLSAAYAFQGAFVRAWRSWLLLMLGLLATVATLVRTAWLATAVGLAAVALMVGRKALPRAAALAVAAALLVTVAAATMPEVAATLGAAMDRLGATDTVAARLNESGTALGALATPAEWLTGSGLGLTVQDDAHPYQHDSFVWFLANEGVIGLGIFVIALVAAPAVIGISSLFRLTGDRRVIMMVLLAGHAANVVGGLSSGHLTNWEYAPIFGMTVGWIGQLAATAALRPTASRAGAKG